MKYKIEHRKIDKDFKFILASQFDTIRKITLVYTFKRLSKIPEDVGIWKEETRK